MGAGPYRDRSRAGRAADPAAAYLYIRALDRSPGDAVGRLFLARIAGMRREGVIESFAVDVLSVRRQVLLHRRRQIIVREVGHECVRRWWCGLPGSSEMRAIGFAHQGNGHARPRGTSASALAKCGQAFLMAIFFSLFCASGVFGKVTVSTPFLKPASILSASTPSGTLNERWNEP